MLMGWRLFEFLIWAIMRRLYRLNMASCSIGGRQKERRGDTKSTPSLKECECWMCFFFPLQVPAHCFEHSGINRVVNNFELALPIIDDAFR